MCCSCVLFKDCMSSSNLGFCSVCGSQAVVFHSQPIFIRVKIQKLLPSMYFDKHLDELQLKGLMEMATFCKELLRTLEEGFFLCCLFQ